MTLVHKNRMKLIIMVALATLFAFSQGLAARAKGASAKLFACSVGGKQVSVTVTGKRLVYHYGTAHKDEMSIIGVPASGNIFQMWQRYAGIEKQLRFTTGEFSYIVYSVGGNERVGAHETSGLVVMGGDKTILDKTCSPFAELELPGETFAVPQDTDKYSAM
jgi:hypothetical protein